MKDWFSALPFRFQQFQFPRKSRNLPATRRVVRMLRPQVEVLEDRLVLALTALGAGPGGQPLVTILNESGAVVRSFNAYAANFTGGVTVALGDVNGDGVDDFITGAGPGGGPHVKVFDGVTFTEIKSFFAYDAHFTGGVNVSAADVNGDGAADIITGAGAGGGPHVQVFDGRTLTVLRGFYAYGAAFSGGVHVAVGDLNGDLLPDIITGAGAGGGPHVRAFDAATGNEVASFFAYNANFTGGVNVAAGDVNGNGTAELLTGAGAGGGPHVRVWTAVGSNPTMIEEFMAGSSTDRGGIRVGSTPGSQGTPDRIAVTSQSSAAPLNVYDLTGQLLGTNTAAAMGVAGFSISSPSARPDLLLRYHTLSQALPAGGAGRLESVGTGQYRLTIKGISADTRVEWFDDVPGRGTGQDTVADFVNLIWPRQYGSQGVNAVLESSVGASVYGDLFQLTNPQLDATHGTLIFAAKPLQNGKGPDRPPDVDRLILGLSPSDVTTSGGSIPAVNHVPVNNFAIAAVGGTISANGTAGTLTLTTPLNPTAFFHGVPLLDTHEETVNDFVAQFSQRFGTRTPNAAVLFQDAQGAEHVVKLNLASVRLQGNDAVFDVTFTQSISGGSLTLPLLFIDSSNGLTDDPEQLPAQSVSQQFLYDDPTLQSLNKTITLINNDPTKTVYPFLRGVNDGISANVKNQNPADPPYWDSADNGVGTNKGTSAKAGHNEEYRAYVGYYAKDGTRHFGLPPGAQITFRVPLAFWDGARIFIATDQKYLKPDNQVAAPSSLINNPYTYFQRDRSGNQTVRFIADDGTDKSGKKQPILWYHYADSAGPLNPTEDGSVQLAEFTIRDPHQANVPKSQLSSVANELGPLFNYDLSYVDDMLLPVALETSDVPLPALGGPPAVPVGPHDPTAYGWAGTILSVDQLQQPGGPLAQFTSYGPSNGLGQYFAGQGWSKFNIPNNPYTKVPSGAEVFKQTPYGDHESNYSSDGLSPTTFALANGGSTYRIPTDKFPATRQTPVIDATDRSVITNIDPNVIAVLQAGMKCLDDVFPPFTYIKEIRDGKLVMDHEAKPNVTPTVLTFVGSQFTASISSSTGQTLNLDKSIAANLSILESLKVGMVVTSDAGDVGAGARIQSINADLANPTITLTGTVGAGKNFTFSGAVSDYVADKLLGLWYAWSDFYVDYVTKQLPYVGDIANGQIQKGDRVLTFPTDTQTKTLYTGMSVSCPGILPDGTTIASFGSTANPNDRTIVNLSQVAANSTSGTGSSFTIGLPIPINYDVKLQKSTRSSIVPTVKLDFSNGPQAVDPGKFAAAVYRAMSAMSTIPQVRLAGNAPTLSDSAIGLMIDVIGCNVGFPAELIGVGAVRDTITGAIRDDIKSVLRGVSNFTAPAETEASGKWYPDPSVATVGATLTVNGTSNPANYNVYNLDPYVWFIHKKLGISSYAFSVDDDRADVQSRGSTNLQVSIGGVKNLANSAGWTFGAPYGPENGTGTLVTGGTQDVIKNLPVDLWRALGHENQVEGSLGAFVNGAGIQPDTRASVLQEAVGNDHYLAYLSQPADTSHAVSGPATYAFFGIVHATGTIDPLNTPTIISGLSPEVIAELNKITANGQIGAGQDGKMRNGALVVRGPGIKTFVRVLSINAQTSSVELEQPLDSTLVPAGTNNNVNQFTFF